MKSVSFRRGPRLSEQNAVSSECASNDAAASEGALLDRARGGDASALGELYDRYAAKVHAYVLYRVGNKDLAEDLTADVFVKMLDAVRTSSAWQTTFTGWLYRIAHNAIIDHFRRRENGRFLPLDEQITSSDDDPVAATEDKARADSIGRALLQLTDDQQIVLVCKFYVGLTNLEIADQLGKTEGAVKSLQYRALGALRRVLEGAAKDTHD